MAEIIGFSNPVNLEWLNAAAFYATQGVARQEAGEKLHETISQTIKSPDNIRKIKKTLLAVWYETTPLMLEEAKAVFSTGSIEDRPALNYALLADLYRVSYDISDVLGHLFYFRDVISATQIKQKIFEKWGQRATLDTALSKILKTMRDIDILNNPGSKSTYACTKHTISNPQTVGILLMALLKNTTQSYISWSAFLSSPFMFPFEVTGVDEASIAALPYIELSRFDGQMVFSVREN